MKRLLCVDGAFRTLGSFGLENTIALPSPPELPLWTPQRTRKRSCCGTPDWMPAQGVVSPRTLHESSPGFLSLRVLVRNKWGNNIRRVLTPSIPRCPGTRDITLRWICPSLCSGWALAFSLAQLLFPLALITVFSWRTPVPLPMVWVPSSGQRLRTWPTPDQLEWPFWECGSGAGWHLDRKLSELLKAGIRP